LINVLGDWLRDALSAAASLKGIDMKRITRQHFRIDATIAFAGPTTLFADHDGRHFPSATRTCCRCSSTASTTTRSTSKGTVAPGMHQATVDLHARKGFRDAGDVPWMRRCTRYYIAAS
jgi:hypothetical protein